MEIFGQQVMEIQKVNIQPMDLLGLTYQGCQDMILHTEMESMWQLVIMAAPLTIAELLTVPMV